MLNPKIGFCAQAGQSKEHLYGTAVQECSIVRYA